MCLFRGASRAAPAGEQASPLEGSVSSPCVSGWQTGFVFFLMVQPFLQSLYVSISASQHTFQ